MAAGNRPRASSSNRRYAALVSEEAHRRLRVARPVLLAIVLLLVASGGVAQQSADRIYVRRIEFHGVTRTNDEVLRRELRQLEGTFLNPAALDESRIHLERLPSVAAATLVVVPVPESENLVDIIVTITEEPTRRYGVGGGYASSLRTSVHGYFVNDNLFGAGQQLYIAAGAGELGSTAEASHTNPYAIDAGVSRTIGLTSRRVDRLTTDTSSIDAKLLEGRLEYGYAISDEQSVRLGLALRDTSLGSRAGSSSQLTSWIAANGEPAVIDGAPRTEFTELDFTFRWRADTRNRQSFPDEGLEQLLDVRAALPASEVEYFTVRYDATRYSTIGRSWTSSVHGVTAFGDSLGDTTALPPYLNWLAGGPGTVRGYRGLGPKDSLGNPYGGNLLVAGQLDVKTAWPRRWSAWMRSGFFVDVGNVFSTDDTAFFDGSGQLVDYGFSVSELRASAGVAADLLLPFGTVRLSYAVPLNSSDGDGDAMLRDRVERFQVSFGVDF
jgi:outer membrane protein insertion porin family